MILRDQGTPLGRLRRLNRWVVLALCAIAGSGVALLYSVAGGDWNPWARAHLIRFVPALIIMIVIVMTDLQLWMRWAYAILAVCIMALIAVEIVGATGMGGQRWLNLGVMRIQPSELTKIAIILALARYYHNLTAMQSQTTISLVVPLILVGVPFIMVALQPDLGTALMIFAGGVTMVFLAGASMWLFVGGIGAAAAAVPLLWHFGLHDYQRNRVLNFLNPDRDPLGAGYQITQAKIATGSGGLTGKGYLSGTQSQLDFLPEMKTDFIFTVLTEEFGLFGAALLVLLYLSVLAYAYYVALTTRSEFGRLLVLGLATTLFLYVFINIAMVTGLLPVVGVPLPMVSYGGSAMLTMMIACGLILCVAVQRERPLPRSGSV